MSELNAAGDRKTGLYKVMESPDFYPHEPKDVKHVQTHISHVYIVPPLVYKVKKPVDLGFLDFSTLEKRKYFCKCEVQLNRRLCSDIYLGVVPIAQKGDNFILEPQDETGIVEYAVKMKKLEERYFLHSLIDNDALEPKHLDRVGNKLADFYLQQNPDKKVKEFGTIERIKYNTDENFEQTEAFIDDTIDREAYNAIQYFTNEFFKRNEELFSRRKEEGCIIDGHGDLHLEHIHIKPDRVCIYDCIEFNERLRYGDWAVDLAFLAMDLDFNERWDLERYFVHKMTALLDDSDLPVIIDFYKCYRAYVKGKVKSIHSTEEEVSKQERDRVYKLAGRYFDLSLRYALLGSRPVVIILMGGVGTGKSTLARHLSDKMGIENVSSDSLRKSLAGLPLDERTPEAKREALYHHEMSRKVYNALFEKAETNLKKEESIILDATFSNRDRRKEFINRFNKAGMAYLFVEVVASEETVKSRLRERESKSEVISDARLEDFEMLQQRYQSPDDKEIPHLITVNTDHSKTDTVNELYRKLADRQVEIKE